jgi:hypothetical protein
MPFTGSGSEVFLRFRVFRDLPLDNLQFYYWNVRSFVTDCPGLWQNDNFVFYGQQLDWFQAEFALENFIDFAASDIQVMVAGIDLCGNWCGVFGTASCHSHAPLFDNVEVVRVDSHGPRFSVRHLNLFQDTFAEDGTLTGHARADAAVNTGQYYSPTILPGDSVVVTVTGGPDPLAVDENTGVGPAVYAYVAVWPPNQAGKDGADLEASETRPGVGKRYPLVGSVLHDGVTWSCFRADTVLRQNTSVVPNQYCFDLNDWALTPGDTICYVFCARDSMGNANYWTRDTNGQGRNLVTNSLSAALSTPCEFTILPAGGWRRGGDILYVDVSDDRGGPSQLFYDSTFELLGLDGLVDRYDVLDPSVVVDNTLASRVKNVVTQINNCYRKIIWSTGTLTSGHIGDGVSNPNNSDDFGLLFNFLDTNPNNPGVYFNGDDLANEWNWLSGSSALNLKSIYMNHGFISNNHIAQGEAVSPVLTAVGPCFIELGIPNQVLVFGGCPRRDFDVMQPAGLSVTEFPYPSGAGAAVLSQATPNSAASTARVMLSGFSFEAIRSITPGFPPVRVQHMRNILVWLQNIVPTPSGVPELSGDYLSNAAPNPFNPKTTIRYGIKTKGLTTVKVYNVAGQLVRTLVNDVQTPRPEGFEITWDGRSNTGNAVSSGVYFYRLNSPGFSQTKKMVLLK